MKSVRVALHAPARIIAWAPVDNGRAEVPQAEGFDLARAHAYHGLLIWDFFVEISLYG
jgi:hypothetical protein